MTYPNYYYPTQYNYQSQQTNQSSIIWVQGEAGAKSYLVAPNTTVSLWDSENQTIYLKSADASGMPSIKVLDYTIRAAERPSNAISSDTGKSIGADDLNALQRQIDALKHDIEELKGVKDE